MNVENAIRERLDHGRAEDPHEPREADHVDSSLAKLTDQRTVVFMARGPMAVTDTDRLDAGTSRSLKPFNRIAIRDHNGDRRIEPPVADGVDQCLEIATPSRDEYAYPPQITPGVISTSNIRH
jgi:hypothetical protein